jgi:hypothetical protein
MGYIRRKKPPIVIFENVAGFDLKRKFSADKACLLQGLAQDNNVRPMFLSFLCTEF